MTINSKPYEGLSNQIQNQTAYKERCRLDNLQSYASRIERFSCAAILNPSIEIYTIFWHRKIKKRKEDAFTITEVELVQRCRAIQLQHPRNI